LKSTSCKIIAEQVLEQCLAGNLPKQIPSALLQDAGGPALFGIVVEGLADRFEPSLCDIYARLFSKAVARVMGADPGMMVARYERVRRTRPIAGKPHRIFVLSRVTLGADVAVTSVLMAAAKRRFPHAEIVFVGPRKNYELFAGDKRIHHAEVVYRRGGLRERLAVAGELQAVLAPEDSVVIDPDSRITQLGLVPVFPEERYHLFESRAYGGDSDRPLPELAAAWAAETLGSAGAKPYISLGEQPRRAAYVAVSLGVGENPAKRLADPFEEELLKLLGAQGVHVCIDKGAGGEEAERVAGAVERSGVRATLWEGSFAGFAAIIAGSRLYVGYDSAGQHVAAACGVPLVSVFAGFPVPRMFQRWRPVGEHCRAIQVDRPDVPEVLEKVREAISGAGV
jgi:ADP-heptose:LPS heptosyltransferase